MITKPNANRTKQLTPDSPSVPKTAARQGPARSSRTLMDLCSIAKPSPGEDPDHVRGFKQVSSTPTTPGDEEPSARRASRWTSRLALCAGFPAAEANSLPLALATQRSTRNPRRPTNFDSSTKPANEAIAEGARPAIVRIRPGPLHLRRSYRPRPQPLTSLTSPPSTRLFSHHAELRRVQ